MFISLFIVLVLVSAIKCLQAMMFKKHIISFHTVCRCGTSIPPLSERSILVPVSLKLSLL